MSVSRPGRVAARGGPAGAPPFGVWAVQTGPQGPDLEVNLRGSLDVVRVAGAHDGVVVLPEMFARPFCCVGASDPSYFDWAEPLDGPTVSGAAALARELRCVVVAPFFERGTVDGEYYNSAVVLGSDGVPVEGQLSDGSAVRTYRKNAVSAFRWEKQVNDEKYYFRPGPGYATFDTERGRLGVLICLDRWFPEAWRSLALQGAQVVCVSNASQGDVDDLFVASIRTYAAQSVLYAVAVNRAGVEQVGPTSVRYYGQSCVVDPNGTVLAQAGKRPEVISAHVDLGLVTATRHWRTMFRVVPSSTR